MRVTKNQKITLNFIVKSTKKNGYSPSYREIRDALGYSAVSTVALHVDNLIKAGLLRKDPVKARSLEVVQPDELSLIDRIDLAVSNASQDDLETLRRALILLGYDVLAKEIDKKN